MGKFGQTLATALANEKQQVMIIDAESDIVSSLADTVTNAVVGDPTSEAVLRASGVRDYDCAVVCMSSNINDSILITMLLKEIGVKKVVARAASDHHKKVLEKIGADYVVFPEQDMGLKLAHVLSRNNVIEYIQFSKDFLIAEVITPSKWEGKSIAELNIRQKYGVTIIAINDKKKGNIDVSPNPERTFSKGDLITLMGKTVDVDKITNMN